MQMVGARDYQNRQVDATLENSPGKKEDPYSDPNLRQKVKTKAANDERSTANSER
jgi:hypothetical protein